MTGPSNTPRSEHTPRPGVTWQTELVPLGEVVYDPEDTSGQIANSPLPPRPNRATRRALARAARKRNR